MTAAVLIFVNARNVKNSIVVNAFPPVVVTNATIPGGFLCKALDSSAKSNKSFSLPLPRLWHHS
jgi:hypothetical protein